MICRSRIYIISNLITVTLLSCYQEKPTSISHQLVLQKDSLDQSSSRLTATIYYNNPYLYKTTTGKTTAIVLKENHTYTKNSYWAQQNESLKEEKGKWEIKGRTLQLRDQLNKITSYSIGEQYLQVQDIKNEDSIIRYTLTKFY